MSDRSQHLSDDVILQLIDNELHAPLAERVQAHLEACATCRDRHLSMASTSRALSEFFRSDSFEPIASAAVSRVQLRSRFAERGKYRSVLSIHQIASYFGIAAATSLAVVVLGIVFYGWKHTGKVHNPRTELQAETIVPNHSLTPGAVHPVSMNEICSSDDGDLDPQVSPETAKAVLQEYGLQAGSTVKKYQIDFLVNPQLGGTNDIKNLWPESYSSGKWNARTKDELERRLHKMVCDRTVDLALAQKEIATNWIAAYEKYVGHEHS